MENLPKPEPSGWLQDLAAKSWSLEMTISGAATVAVSFLPRLIDQGLDYYLDNLAPGAGKLLILLPLLAYSFFQVVAWVLIVFFVLHLCMRALWVGAVGLHASYPEGIRYERLPNVSDLYRKVAAEHYGSLEQFILRLDRRCNRLFAVAFMIAMGLAGIGILYLILFGVMLVMRAFLSQEMIEIAGIVLYVVFMVFLLMVMGLQFWLKKHPEKEGLGMFMARLQIGFTHVVLPIVGRPSQYLSMTFMTNMGRWQFYGSLVLLMVIMIGSTVAVSAGKTNRMFGRMGHFNRDYFTDGGRRYVAPAALYDASRGPEDGIPDISIPEAAVSGKWLSVFVKYPHYWDARLKKVCSDNGDSVPDSLPGRIRREQIDSIRLSCFSSFLRVQLNDTLDLKPEWLFSEKNGTPGLITYLPTTAFPSGKNILIVKIPSEEKSDSLEVFGVVPFWVGEE